MAIALDVTLSGDHPGIKPEEAPVVMGKGPAIELALFSVSDFDGDESSLNVAYIKTDREGYDYIEEIEDEKILKKAMEIVQDMMGVINNG